MVMMKRLGVVWVIAALCGCAGMAITSDYDPAASFSGLKTYAWLPDPEKKPVGLHGENPLLDAYIRKTVESQLVAKGYEKHAPETADFLVGYNGSLVSKMSVTALNSYYDYPQGWGWNYAPGYYSAAAGTQVYEYTEGTLIIDVANPKTRQLIWRGSAKTELDRHPSVEEKKDKINKAVRRILDRFSPEENSKP